MGSQLHKQVLAVLATFACLGFLLRHSFFASESIAAPFLRRIGRRHLLAVADASDPRSVAPRTGAPLSPNQAATATFHQIDESSLPPLPAEPNHRRCNINNRAAVSGFSAATNHAVTYRYLVSEDAPKISQWGKLMSRSRSTGLVYARNPSELGGGAAGSVNCAGLIDVFAWLMDEVNACSGTLMLTYGGLIHLHREREFVDSTGKYIDDDIDLWSSLETLAIVGSWERDLYEKFGWSMRFIVNHEYVMLMQLFPVCGHHVFGKNRARRKIESMALELYPLLILPMVSSDKGMSPMVDGHWGRNKTKCVWTGNQFPVSMTFPPKSVHFKSTASTKMLHLQIPNDSFGFLRCMYGTWEVPSRGHASLDHDCTGFYSRN